MKLPTLLVLMLFGLLAFASPTITDQSCEFEESETLVDPTAELCDAILIVDLASAKSIIMETSEELSTFYILPCHEFPEKVILLHADEEPHALNNNLKILKEMDTNSRRDIPPSEYSAFTDTSEKKKKVYKPTNKKWYDHFYRSSSKRN